MIERRDDRQTALSSDRFGAPLSLQRRRTLEEHFGALPPDPLHLDRRRIHRNDDDRRYSQLGRGERHGTPVVSRRIRRYAPGSIFLRKLHDEVVRASKLEGATALQILTFQAESAAPHGRRSALRQKRGSPRYAVDPTGGGTDFVDIDKTFDGLDSAGLGCWQGV
jgi:hypothetical protein